MTVLRGLFNFRPKKSQLEILAIVAFLMADCFLSGWTLTAGAIAAFLYLAIPAIRTMWSQTALERIVFLKAYVKTSRVQKVAVLLFWLLSIRWILFMAIQCRLFAMPNNESASLTNIFFHGAANLAPIAFLASPVLIYLIASLMAIAFRSRLKATRSDPDLIKQRQRWTGLCQGLFSGAFFTSIFSITFYSHGPVRSLSNWLLNCARDANLDFEPEAVAEFQQQLESTGEGYFHNALPVINESLFNSNFITDFHNIMAGIFSIVAILLLWQPAVKLHAFLNSFTWRVVSLKSLENIIESLLRALHLPGQKLNFRESQPLLRNAIRTIVWLSFCYLVLFWAASLSGGPLGSNNENFRIFLASMVALYGTPIFAIYCTIFLPFAKPRKIVVNADGMTFAQGPFFSLWGRQYRLWSDLKAITVEKKSNANYVIKFAFSSGGKVKLNKKQISAYNLRLLLNYAEQHAINCAIGSEVFEAIESYEEQDKSSERAIKDPVSVIRNEEFKSTIFSPHDQGEYLPESRTRIIKQLASKPLCAVYLARTEEGRMANVKQFYLADETEETKAFSKILNREFDLLSKLDHPGLAKVLNCYTVGKSTYLLIEYRPGTDLKDMVQNFGPRSENVTKKWAKQICEIMIYLHDQEPSILHRDLTPDNIIAGEDGQLRLIDFGAAREFLEGITGTMIGKQCYVPPEQLRGEATEKSDIYAFGCTLYYLLTGRDPIALSPSSASDIVDCTDDLNQLIIDCTNFDAINRPGSFKEILDRLNSIDGSFKLKLNPLKEKVMTKA